MLLELMDTALSGKLLQTIQKKTMEHFQTASCAVNPNNEFLLLTYAIQPVTSALLPRTVSVQFTNSSVQNYSTVSCRYNE